MSGWMLNATGHDLAAASRESLSSAGMSSGTLIVMGSPTMRRGVSALMIFDRILNAVEVVTSGPCPQRHNRGRTCRIAGCEQIGW